MYVLLVGKLLVFLEYFYLQIRSSNVKKRVSHRSLQLYP